MPNQLQRSIGKKIPIKVLQGVIARKKSAGTLTDQELDFALRTAARIGTREQLEEIIRAGANLDAQGLDRTLLDLSLSNPDIETVKGAAEKRNFFNNGSKIFYNLIEIAVFGDHQRIKDLMQLQKSQLIDMVRPPNQAGRNIFFYATALGQAAMLLLDEKIDFPNPKNTQLSPSDFCEITMHEFGKYIFQLRNGLEVAGSQFYSVLNNFDKLIKQIIEWNNYPNKHIKNKELVNVYRQKATLYAFRGEYYLNQAQNLLDDSLPKNKEECDKAEDVSDKATKNFLDALAVLETIPGEYLTEVDRINNRTIARSIRDNLYTAYYCLGTAVQKSQDLLKSQPGQNVARMKAVGRRYFSMAIEEATLHIEEVDNETIVAFLSDACWMYGEDGPEMAEHNFCKKVLQIFNPGPGVLPEQAPQLYDQLIDAGVKCKITGINDFVPIVLKFIYQEFVCDKLPRRHLKTQLQEPANLNRLVALIKQHDPRFQEKKSAAELVAENAVLRKRNAELELILKEQIRGLEVQAKLAKDKLAALDDEKPSQQQASAGYPGFHASLPAHRNF